jgi:hypothetical protein
MDSKNSLENNRSQTYRAILIHKILQDICTEKMANGCRKPFDINAEIEILSNKIADNLDSDIEEENEKDESEKIEEIYNDIVEIFKRNAKNSADFYYNDLCEEIASCIVKCLVEPKKEAHCEDLFSINEAVCMLLDLDLDCILVARNNFTTCVNGAIDILLGGERSKIYDIRLVTFVETWFLEINNAVMDMHERVKRGILSGSLKSIRDDTYYIKYAHLCAWARDIDIILDSGTGDSKRCAPTVTHCGSSVDEERRNKTGAAYDYLKQNMDKLPWNYEKIYQSDFFDALRKQATPEKFHLSRAKELWKEFKVVVGEERIGKGRKPE